MTLKIRRCCIIIACICVVLALSVFCDLKGSRAYAASSGRVTSVTNTASGIQVKWSKDASRSGYYIYRKVGSGKWYRVQTVSRNSITSWIDKNTKNGKKYSYRVRGFSGVYVSKNTTSKSTYRLTRPKIKGIKAPSERQLEVTSTSNSEATGFHIRYSRYASFKSYKSIFVTGTRATKTLKDLLSGLYYIKVRAYKKVKDVKYYSDWSPVTTKRAYRYVYTTNNWTTLCDGKDFDSPTNIGIWYRTKLRDYGKVDSYTAGDWRKVRYSGKTYYLWVTSNDPKITTKTPKTNYSSSYKYRNEVVQKALWIYNNWKTKYDPTGVADNEAMDENKRHALDCSGFTSYVLNSVMQQYIPAYRITRNIAAQADVDVIINEGFPQELRTEIICKKLSYDKLAPGDLIFFNNDEDKYADHVGIYLGNHEFIHSTSTYMRNPQDYISKNTPTGGVCISPLKGYYESVFMVAKRFVPNSIKNTKINKKMVALKKVSKIYAAYNCNSSSLIEGEVILKDEIAYLLYTKKLYSSDGTSFISAYMKYGENLDKYGFIYEYGTKFTDYVDPPPEPEEPEEPEEP